MQIPFQMYEWTRIIINHTDLSSVYQSQQGKQTIKLIFIM